MTWFWSQKKNYGFSLPSATRHRRRKEEEKEKEDRGSRRTCRPRCMPKWGLRVGALPQARHRRVVSHRPKPRRAFHNYGCEETSKINSLFLKNNFKEKKN